MSDWDLYPDYERDLEPGEVHCITNQNAPHGIQWQVDPETGRRVELYWLHPHSGKHLPPETVPRNDQGKLLYPIRAPEGMCEACFNDLMEGGGCVACPTHGIQPKATGERAALLTAEGLVACAVCAALTDSQRAVAQSPPAVDRAFPEDDFGRGVAPDGDLQERPAQLPAPLSRPALVNRLADGLGGGGPARPVPRGTGAGAGDPGTPSESDVQGFFDRRRALAALR
jgi:hypothetical protein